MKEFFINIINKYNFKSEKIDNGQNLINASDAFDETKRIIDDILYSEIKSYKSYINDIYDTIGEKINKKISDGLFELSLDIRLFKSDFEDQSISIIRSKKIINDVIVDKLSSKGYKVLVYENDRKDMKVIINWYLSEKSTLQSKIKI